MQCTSTRTVPAYGDEDAFDVTCARPEGHGGQHDTDDLGGYRYEWSDDEDPWLAKAGA